MNTKRGVTIGIVIAAFALVGLGTMELLLGPRSLMAGFDRGMQASYEKISVGKTKQAVVDALGEPRAKSNKFNLPQRHGFEHFFDAAERSSAMEYYQWINGMNWYYSIGFDSAGAVVMKGEGHS